MKCIKVRGHVCQHTVEIDLNYYTITNVQYIIAYNCMTQFTRLAS